MGNRRKRRKRRGKTGNRKPGNGMAARRRKRLKKRTKLWSDPFPFPGATRIDADKERGIGGNGENGGE
jgi:hypothetical protein